MVDAVLLIQLVVRQAIHDGRTRIPRRCPLHLHVTQPHTPRAPRTAHHAPPKPTYQERQHQQQQQLRCATEHGY